MNPFIKIVVGAAILVFIVAFVDPLLQILQLFFSIVLIPLMLIASLLMVSEGTFQAWKNGIGLNWPEKLRARVDEYRAKFDMADEAI